MPSIHGGRIDGRLRGGTDHAFLDGIVGEDAVFETGTVEFGAAYRANGGTELTLSEDWDPAISPFVPENVEVTFEEPSQFFTSGWFYWSFISMFVTGLLMTLVFPGFSRALTDYAGAAIAPNKGTLL